ncbi:peptidase associated/transthyretin-like domain-containing protein [Aurantiacibacter spongiae]|uniref:Carboxypeptidase regulatory-like domain-containing protein n=1 Tax=Aurantiacibacter spongiae TaxID=2488860 RepID=A0A3N5CP45_9SPHN|nr:carboxypeptidase regulatory-like domain-containing protein [Aurantiacibacter spongiae]RPF70753.1 carboxypeptidase regulatory-like domain-containing protein [Aurantiacibacter spongiae]
MKLLAPAALLASMSVAGAAQAGDVAGKVYGADALPRGGVAVSLPDLDRTTRTATDGSYRFDGVPAGSLVVAVAASADAVQRARVDVPETGEARRDVFLYSARVIGSVRDGGDPLVNALAERSMASAWDAASAMVADAAPTAWRWRDSDG